METNREHAAPAHQGSGSSMPRPPGTATDAAYADEVRGDDQALVQPTVVVSRQSLAADLARPAQDLSTHAAAATPADTAGHAHDALSTANAPAAPRELQSDDEQRDSFASADTSAAEPVRSTPLVGPNSTTLYDPNPRAAQPWRMVAESGAAPSFHSAAEPLRPPPARRYDAPPRQQLHAPTQVPWHVASSWGDTTLHIESNTAAGASYFFWWVSGLLVYFNERNNRYVRFHAMQSILLSGAMTVFAVLTSIVAALCWDVAARTQLRVLYALGNGIAVLAVVTIVMVWIGTMVAAWTGHLIRLPILGEYADRYAAPAMPVSPPMDD